MQEIIGRTSELQTLKDLYNSQEAEFIAVYGRRRVGKTFLIRRFFGQQKDVIYFEVTGLKNGSLQEQLKHFAKALSVTFNQDLFYLTPTNWHDAFALLTSEIAKISVTKKLVVFFDELPWLATKKSKLIQYIDFFWNSKWSAISNLKLVVCGSAASWMLDNLVHAKGGLYNRITKSILLQPFSLQETSLFLSKRNIKLTKKQIADLYMVMGGIPHYLKQIAPGQSAAQNINSICFQAGGLLYDEFDKLFASLFDDSENHLKIITVLAEHKCGMTRTGLLQTTKISSGGRFNKSLEELQKSGFIRAFIPYGMHTKEKHYQIIDEYTAFYFSWIFPVKEQLLEVKSNYWQTKASTPAWKSWAGFAFELLCFKHVNNICKALGIFDLDLAIGSWRYIPKKRDNTAGAQIDLLFDRNDQCITLCEIKYTDKEFTIDKKYALELMQKIEIFSNQTKTQKKIFLCMISASGLKSNVWSSEIVDNQVTLDDLF